MKHDNGGTSSLKYDSGCRTCEESLCPCCCHPNLDEPDNAEKLFDIDPETKDYTY